MATLRELLPSRITEHEWPARGSNVLLWDILRGTAFLESPLGTRTRNQRGLAL